MKKISSEELLKKLKSATELSAEMGALKSLSKSGLNNPLLLVTEEVVRAKKTVAWICDNLIADKNLEVQKYFGDDLRTKKAGQEVCHVLGAPSLFSPLQIAVIYNADKVRVAAADPIAAMLSNGSASGLLILVAGKYNAKAAFFSRIAKVATVAEFAPLSDARLKKWVAKEAQALGIAGVEPKAAHILIQALGGDLQLLSAELAKLSLLCEPDEVLQTSLVEQFVSFSPEVGSFDLFAAIANKNVIKAEVLLKKLVSQGFHPLQISSFLSRCLRTLLAMCAKEAATHSKELSNPWFQRNMSKHSRAFSIKELQAATSQIATLDYLLKGGGVSDALSISSVVRKISQRNF